MLKCDWCDKQYVPMNITHITYFKSTTKCQDNLCNECHTLAVDAITKLYTEIHKPKCKECWGTGMVDIDEGNVSLGIVPCNKCKGSGKENNV